MFIKKITTTTKEKLIDYETNYNSIDSISISNVDNSNAATIELYLLDISGSNIIDTGTNSNEGENAITTSSVTLTVDGTAATADIFENENVYNSSGDLIGLCTARNSDTEIVFGNGIDITLPNNTDLYTGARIYILKNVVIPVGSSLWLQGKEIKFGRGDFALYIKTTRNIDVIIRD